MTAIPAEAGRQLWQPTAQEQTRAAELALCGELHRDARQAVRDRMQAWLIHAKGCRRRAHEYKRWALEYELSGNLPKYRHYRQQSDRSWVSAKDALIHARREYESL
ncbi:hypothetical protein [Mesorhizobium sp. BE184]|uniref:hypothetical protein n=1 Tax=Mesorhizobium sp. BE184 TaxID=2817714 RepID=UPI00285E8B58|nr:hypothetical protein [Mesorhizobium sp. BE184]MDR7032395.1 hypothetical protein [Mesorhizobium sp. BE184]